MSASILPIDGHALRWHGQMLVPNAGVFAAATVLAISQTIFETLRKPPEGQKHQAVNRLPEPDSKLTNHSKKWKAPVWQEGTAQEIIERARKASSRFKK